MLKVACDTHTHTLHSRHAYSTIAENVAAARAAGLDLLASTDHFSAMLWPLQPANQVIKDYQFFLNYHAWPAEWDGVRVLHGCEADIVDLDGGLYGHDVPVSHSMNGNPLPPGTTLADRVFQGCDYVIASVHGKRFCEGASIEEATGMYLGALANPKVLVLGHTGRSGVSFDIEAVVGAARDAHKLIELNEHSLSDVADSRATCWLIAETCKRLGCQISIASDAHVCVDVGRFDYVLAMLDEIGFPEELVASRSRESFLAAIEAAGV